METFPDPLPGRLVLLEAPRPILRQLLPDWIARKAALGCLRVLDCGNSFNAHALSRALRARTAQLQPALERILLARAFTCYQAAALLEQTPGDGTPILLLDLPDTFQDDSVSLWERRRLFWGCVQRLRMLKRRAALLASLSPPATMDEKMRQVLEAAADQVWQALPPPPAPVLQPSLYPW